MDSSTRTSRRSANRPFSLWSRKSPPQTIDSNPVPSTSAKKQAYKSLPKIKMIISQRNNNLNTHKRQQHNCYSSSASLLASDSKERSPKQFVFNQRIKRSMQTRPSVRSNTFLVGSTIGSLLFILFVATAKTSQHQRKHHDSKQLAASSSLYGYRTSSSLNNDLNSNQASDIDTVRVLQIEQPSPTTTSYPSARSNGLINLIDNSASASASAAYNQSNQQEQPIVYTNGVETWPAPMGTANDLHDSSRYAVASIDKPATATVVESRRSSTDLNGKQPQNIVVHSLITVHTTKESPPVVANGHHYHTDNIAAEFHPPSSRSVFNPSVDETIGANIEPPPLATNIQASSPSKLNTIDPNPSESSYTATQSPTIDMSNPRLKYEYLPSFFLKPSSSAVSTYDVTRTLAQAVAMANKIDLSNSRRRPNGNNSRQQHHSALLNSHPFYEIDDRDHHDERQRSRERDSTSYHRASSHSNNQHYPAAAVNTRRQSSYSVSDQCALLLDRLVDANNLIEGVGSGLQMSSALGSHRPTADTVYHNSYRSNYYGVAGSSPMMATSGINSWNGQRRRVKRHQQYRSSQTDNEADKPMAKAAKSGGKFRELIDGNRDWSSKVRVSSVNPDHDYVLVNNSNKTSEAGRVLVADHLLTAKNDTGLGDDVDPMLASASGAGGQVCITFDHVDEALQEAKRELEFQMPDDLDDPEPSDGTLNVIGELNQLVTEILANRFDLSSDEILNGLPMIDIKQTNMWSSCPTIARQIECMPNNRYRSITGHCNNLNYPTMGAANTPFVRYVPSDYADGVSEPRVSAVDLSELPSARTVVSLVHQDYDRPSSELSLLIMSWGQLVDHDLALATPPSESSGHNLKCCPNNDHSLCLPIRVAPDDPKYARHNIKCLEFKRSLAGVRPNCALGPRAQLNAITSSIDANFIYGTNVDDARELREFNGGRLRTWNYFSEEGLKPLLPPQQNDPDVDCVNRPRGLYCFIAGDVRVNEQTQLTALHIMHVREHNRVASILESLNGHWSDERIYQETRHIIAAIIQHIILAEYLPALIGPDVCAQYNLTEAVTYWDHYDPEVNIGISNSFSTAAFRQGHTFVQGVVRRYNSRHQLVATHQLRNLFRQPWPLFQPGALDEFVLGLVDTPAQSFDPFLAEDISGHLFQQPGAPVGFDLPSINIQRAREQGVPGYNTFREWCGLPRAYSFMDLEPYLSNFTAYQYSLLYKHVDDIDLFSGGLSEQRLPGAQVGPTFACIIARQFSNLRRGDRFWFENSMMPSSFTPEQLIEIKKTSLARILCSNSDYIQDIQRSAFHLPHPIFNERIPCAMLPDIDFRYWQEGVAKS